MTPEQKNDLRLIAAVLTVASYALEPGKRVVGMDANDSTGKVMRDYKEFLRRLNELS